MTNEFSEPPLEFRIMPLVQPSPTNDPVDKELIRKICENGLSECPDEDRCFAWLVLLNVFPRYAVEWPDRLSDMIKKYHDFVSDYGVSDWTEKTFPSIVRADNMSVSQPKLMLTIYSDIARSGRQFFFFPAIEPPNDAPDDKLSFFIPHIRRLERILYIFAMLNPSLSYMQGFNELVSPLYFVMVKARQVFDDDLDSVEAVSFHCLQQLITGTSIQEFYIVQDESSLIYHKMDMFKKLLDETIPDIAKIFNNLNIHPLQYAYKSLNLLFAQDNPMPTTLIIWDALLAHIEDLMDYASFVEISRIIEVQHLISPDNFPETIRAIQNINVSNIYVVLKRANQLYKKEKEPSVSKILKKVFTIKKKK